MSFEALYAHKRRVDELDRHFYAARLARNYVAVAATLELFHYVSPDMADRYYKLLTKEEQKEVLNYV